MRSALESKVAIASRQPLFGFAAQAEAILRHEFEGAKDECCIDGRRRLLQENSAVFDREVAVGNARPPALKFLIERSRRRRSLLEQLSCQAIDDAGVPEVGSHPIGC